jgi:hypothetical protein
MPMLRGLLLSFLLASVFLSSADGQAPKLDEAASKEKAEQILERALGAVGGGSYLNIKTVVGRGFYSAYQDGVSQLPVRFVDYLDYPDRERTEFTAEGVRIIQSHIGERGWVYDGATRSLKDMKPEQIEDFKRGILTSMENVLHGWWRNAGAKLTYAGRREAGLAKRNETVRLTYPDGFWVEYEFGAQDGLPSKVIYKRSRKNPDTGETEETTEEDRLAKPIIIGGITVPFVVDHFVNGKQSSRVNYESVEHNSSLPDSLFVKPDNVKAIK